MTRNHDDKWQDQVLDPVEDIFRFPDIISTAAGQPAEMNAENQYQDDTQPESRDIIGGRPHLADGLVQPVFFMQCAENRQQDGKGKYQDIGKAAKQKCIAQQGEDNICHRHLVFERDPKISLQTVQKPVCVLGKHPLVKPQPFSCRILLGLRHHLQRVTIK